MKKHATFCLLAAAFLAIASISLAQSTGPGSPAPAQSASDERCTRRPANRPDHEWAKCMGVEISVSSTPAVGQEFILHVKVSSDAQRPEGTLEVEVPEGLEFTGPSAASARRGRARDGVSPVHRTSERVGLGRGSESNTVYRVKVLAPGTHHIRARVVSEVSEDFTDAASDDFFLVVGAPAGPTSARESWGSPTVRSNVTASAPKLSPLLDESRKRTLATPQGVPFSDDPANSMPRAAAGQSCVTGGWFFLDHQGISRPSMNQTVRVWDVDTYSDDDLLASAVIAYDGQFRLCFNNDDGDPGSNGTQEVLIQFISENSTWKVRDTFFPYESYRFIGEPVTVCDGCEHAFGNLQPAQSEKMRGMHAFASINSLWLFVHGGTGNCFDARDSACRQMVVNWSPYSTDGTYYSGYYNDIHLAADDPNSPTTVIHEGTHALMDDVYEDFYPASPNCATHYVNATSSTGCAWTEGFADWLPLVVLGDEYFRWPDGGSVNLETPTWGSAYWNDGDSTEGRVAGALLDLADYSNEIPNDVSGEGVFRILDTFFDQHSSTYAEFLLVDRPASGYPLNDVNERSSAYQNTIDYGYGFASGQKAVVTNGGNNLPMRANPCLSNAPTGYLPSGSVGTIGPELPVVCDDGRWWRVSWCNGTSGWIAQPIHDYPDLAKTTMTCPACVHGEVCRSAVGECDLAETCSNGSCPSDQKKPTTASCSTDGKACTVDRCDGSGVCIHVAGNSGQVCRPAAGICDVAESCNGFSADCPGDAKQANGVSCANGFYCDGTETCSAGSCMAGTAPCPGQCNETTDSCGCSNGATCRAAQGVCDVAETCVNNTCPPDVRRSGTTCRASTGSCDVAESCNGVSALCPADVKKTDGTICSDGLFCNGVESCASGVCTDRPDPCTTGSCNESSNECTNGCGTLTKPTSLVESVRCKNGCFTLEWENQSESEVELAAVRGTEWSDSEIESSAIHIQGTEQVALCGEPGVSFVYRTRATCGDDTSGWSNMCFVCEKAFPKPTSFTHVPLSNHQVHLSWQHDGVRLRGFKLQRRRTGVETSFQNIAQLGASVREFTDGPLVQNAAYEYRIRALPKLKLCLTASAWTSRSLTGP